MRQLAIHHGLIRGNGQQEATTSVHLTDAPDVNDFLEALSDRSLGNALYATYLCKEAQRQPSTLVNPAETVRNLPIFDGTLESYYAHLMQALGHDGGGSVADVLALVDFSVSREDLKEIRPDLSHRVNDALDTLAPVLVELSSQGGVRIYHESFARFLRRGFQNCRAALHALVVPVAQWLETKGLTDDARAFRSLLPMLHDAGRDQHVVGLVGTDFVARSVASGFPKPAIVSNLKIALRSAAETGDWPAVARYNELARAAQTYEFERFETTLVEFADVALEVLGAEAVAERLLHDGRPVMAGSKGIQLCSAIDKFGGVAPWRQYFEAYERERERENAQYHRDPDWPVRVACLRRKLRMASIGGGLHGSNDSARSGVLSDQPTATDSDADSTGPVDWAAVAKFIDESSLPTGAVVDSVFDTCGYGALSDLARELDNPGDFWLAVAHAISRGRIRESRCEAKRSAEKSVRHGIRSGTVRDLVDLGVDVYSLAAAIADPEQGDLPALTLRVQHSTITFQSEIVEHWVDRCSIAALLDPSALAAADIAIAGTGWYRCWLRFVVGLSRAEVAPADERSTLALAALGFLPDDLRPFEGEPRSCDLDSIHGVIDRTIRRAVELLDDESWPRAMHLLQSVCERITTSLQGQPMGPLPPIRLLNLVIDTACASRYEKAQAIVFDEIENGSGGRHYSDLAEYQLIAARLAIAAGDQQAAKSRWVDACGMLTAYGVHKDLTIFGLLRPLSSLIKADPVRGRRRVARLQSLCWRLLHHTDRKETCYGWPKWWALLAEADPGALANLVASQLHSACNDPNSVLDEARSALWLHWYKEADPFVACALRLTLPDPLTESDPDALKELASTIRGLRTDPAKRLATLFLTRADERPFRYRFSSSDERVDKDSDQVARLNAVASEAGLPRVMPLPEVGNDDSRGYDPNLNPSHSPSTDVESRPFVEIRPQFPSGSVGIAGAVRAWSAVPHGDRESAWKIDFTANLFGYRLVELADAGKAEEAITALRMIADADCFGSGIETLKAIAKGLERFQHTKLAARAFALAWTRKDPMGGWAIFGGEKEISSLNRAFELDRATALEVVAQDTERFVGGHGISEALVHASIRSDLSGAHVSGTNMAFRAWDAACEVVEKRTPRVHSNDDPKNPYELPNPDSGKKYIGDLDIALATAAVAGLAHPGLESKRRSLLATGFLLAERPNAAAPAINSALEHLSDPATLAWLLQLLEQHAHASADVVSKCADVLKEHAKGPHLTVRALARRLLGEQAGPLPTPSSPAPELLRAGPSALVLPISMASSGGDGTWHDRWIDFVAGQRLEDAESMLPGLGDAVRARVSATVSSHGYIDRRQSQNRALSDLKGIRRPDAFLVSDEAIEVEIQRVAAGGRAALMAIGKPPSDPTAWEDDLTELILDNADLPLAVEATRQPRPSIPPPPGPADAVWQELTAREMNRKERSPIANSQSIWREIVGSTLATHPSSRTPTVESGAFAGWRMIGTAETLTSKPAGSAHSSHFGTRYQGLEFCPRRHQPPLDSCPFGSVNIGIWFTEPPSTMSFRGEPATCLPLLGIDFNLSERQHHCLGVPDNLLAPTPWLISMLQLRPGSPFVLEDLEGPAVSLVTWRTQYDPSEHHLAWPRLDSAAVLVRNDLFERLLNILIDQLVFREYAIQKILRNP